jgi:hypothetical protein
VRRTLEWRQSKCAESSSQTAYTSVTNGCKEKWYGKQNWTTPAWPHAELQLALTHCPAWCICMARVPARSAWPECSQWLSCSNGMPVPFRANVAAARGLPVHGHTAQTSTWQHDIKQPQPCDPEQLRLPCLGEQLVLNSEEGKARLVYEALDARLLLSWPCWAPCWAQSRTPGAALKGILLRGPCKMPLTSLQSELLPWLHRHAQQPNTATTGSKATHKDACQGRATW